jgi:hypothetical protein
LRLLDLVHPHQYAAALIDAADRVVVGEERKRDLGLCPIARERAAKDLDQR